MPKILQESYKAMTSRALCYMSKAIDLVQGSLKLEAQALSNTITAPLPPSLWRAWA
jgi:hypothetical protein